MRVDHAIRTRLLISVSQRVIANAEELTALDRAIGDGDHGINMRRGFEAVLTDVETLSAKTLGDALKGVGTTLVMKVGGASGPLYGTLFMALGKSLTEEITREAVADAFGQAIEAVKLRGKSDVGHKTMLDVLAPVHAVICAGGDDLPARLRATAQAAAQSTIPMKAIRGRASFLGERSVGHMDPGARSSDVARGTASMVEQMVGREVPLGWCGGDPDGGLGTNVEAILKAIEAAWSESGVAILVDLGGAETNSEMAIEMLPAARRERVVVCNAPIVEGAVMAATEAASGATLDAVRRTAEELTPR